MNQIYVSFNTPDNDKYFRILSTMNLKKKKQNQKMTKTDWYQICIQKKGRNMQE